MELESLCRNSGIHNRDSAFLRGHYYAVIAALGANKRSKTSDDFDLRSHDLLLEVTVNGMRNFLKTRRVSTYHVISGAVTGHWSPFDRDARDGVPEILAMFRVFNFPIKNDIKLLIKMTILI